MYMNFKPNKFNSPQYKKMQRVSTEMQKKRVRKVSSKL